MINPLLSLYWVDCLIKFDFLLLGFSGGLDSSVLLHSLWREPLLRPKLKALHVNHNLSINESKWAEHCRTACEKWAIPFIETEIVLAKDSNIEEQAREARYKIFQDHLGVNDALVLGHHLNDQAETLFLNFCRGAGVAGLAGIKAFSDFGNNKILRPFLSYPRSYLEQYALFHQLSWVEDESNQCLTFSRNYIRHKVLPVIQEKWPQYLSSVKKTISYCAEAQTNLEELALIDCPDLAKNNLILPFKTLLLLPVRRIKNVLRTWFRMNKLLVPNQKVCHKLIEELLLAKQDKQPMISWRGCLLRRYKDWIYLYKNQLLDLKEQSLEWRCFPNALVIEALQGTLVVIKKTAGVRIKKGELVHIRFRQGGETIRLKGQRKSLKKLWQEWGVPPWLRNQIPLLYINSELACVVGYAISDLFFSKEQEGYFFNLLLNQS